MKTASLLTALLAAVLLVGCKAKAPPPPAAQAPDPVKVELARMAAATDQLAKDNAELRKALQAMAQREQSNHDLSAQLIQATKNCTDLQNINARLNSALMASEAKLQQAVADFKLAGDKTQAARLDALEAEHRALAKQNEELTAKVEGLHSNPDTDQARQLAKLQQDCAAAQEQIAAIQAQNAMLIWELQQQSQEGRTVNVLWYPSWPLFRHDGGRTGHSPRANPGTPNGKTDTGGGVKSGPNVSNQNTINPMPATGGSQTGHAGKISIRDRSWGGPSTSGNSGGRGSDVASGAGRTQTSRGFGEDQIQPQTISAGQSVQTSAPNGGQVAQSSNVSGIASFGPSKGSRN
jgi:hypothetical protein